ncbi:putative NAD/FAD-binding protein [Natronospira proteinivora]|uniref:NAD/FAD-binding protein n=1 Tax=Natronospira proteinivora TaxID=1807133 RepID=A0ABT1G9J1_9GAMM|nr:FAD-dependent oxidoreductase [Natronospira proteinivora]MCP1727991.1 putative NAD/FAD-binding protein [Natronospira proteinivora]
MRIAVIGGGISGLGSAWLLTRDHEVTLYEAGPRAGGHSNTVSVKEAGRDIPVDTGFIVFNERNYPHLCALFRTLDVASHDSDMSFSASLGQGRLEYAGDNLLKLFAQPANLLRPSHWRMLREILRFNRTALDWLAQSPGEDKPLGEFLRQHDFARELSERYLLPMAAAIWSAPMSRIRDFPASRFLRFFRNHGLLQVSERPQWKTVAGGSQYYVEKIVKALGKDILLDTTVKSIERSPRGVVVRDHRGGEAEFDQVILASHADQSLSMLSDADAEEYGILSAFQFQPNKAYLHSDSALMPRRRRVWASWNYLAESSVDGEQRVSVSYWMNRLQALNSQRNYFVTLNPPRPPSRGLTWYECDYDHPVFDQKAVAAQERLGEIQGRGGIWYAGAWTAYGFHEDGFRSALDVVNAMGVKAPWQATTHEQTPADTAPTPPVMAKEA